MNRIGVDLDGCLVDFITSYKALIIKTTGIDLFPKDREWDSWNFEKEAGYNNKDHLNKVWDTINKSETFWQDLEAYTETDEILAQLYGRALAGDDVYFITTRPSTGKHTAKAQTEDWLRHITWNTGMEAFIPTVIVTADKGPIAAALELTHFIDDKWENVRDVKDAALDCKIYLLDRPWNRAIPTTSIPRVNSVLDMLKELD